MNVPVKPGLYLVRLPCKNLVWVQVLPPDDAPDLDCPDCPSSTMKVACPVEPPSNDEAPSAA